MRQPYILLRRTSLMCITGTIVALLLIAYTLGISHWERKSLQYIGKSLIDDLYRVSLKQVYLNQSQLEGKMLWIQGTIAEVGEHQTYFVITENKRKLLISQVHIIYPKHRVRSHDIKHSAYIKGRLFSDKKGIPALQAQIVLTKPPLSIHSAWSHHRYNDHFFHQKIYLQLFMQKPSQLL